jgi:signal peptidase I
MMPLLNSWSRVLLEKLNYFQLVKELLAFYGTRKFITAFTIRYIRIIILMARYNSTAVSTYVKYPKDDYTDIHIRKNLRLPV